MMNTKDSDEYVYDNDYDVLSTTSSFLSDSYVNVNVTTNVTSPSNINTATTTTAASTNTIQDLDTTKDEDPEDDVVVTAEEVSQLRSQVLKLMKTVQRQEEEQIVLRKTIETMKQQLQQQNQWWTLEKVYHGLVVLASILDPIAFLPWCFLFQKLFLRNNYSTAMVPNEDYDYLERAITFTIYVALRVCFYYVWKSMATAKQQQQPKQGVDIFILFLLILSIDVCIAFLQIASLLTGFLLGILAFDTIGTLQEGEEENEKEQKKQQGSSTSPLDTSDNDNATPIASSSSSHSKIVEILMYGFGLYYKSQEKFLSYILMFMWMWSLYSAFVLKSKMQFLWLLIVLGPTIIQGYQWFRTTWTEVSAMPNYEPTTNPFTETGSIRQTTSSGSISKSNSNIGKKKGVKSD